LPTKKDGTGRLPPRSWTASAGWGTVLIVAYVVVALAPFALVLILNGGFRDNILVELGRGAALVGFVLLVLHVVLAGRFKRLDAPFGLDVVMRFHKRMAIVAVVLLLAHPLLFVIGRGSLALLSTDMPWPIDLGKAALAWAFLIVIFAMLFEQFGVDYNVWLFTHKAAVLILSRNAK
jgi:predicted ferric reductase